MSMRQFQSLIEILGTDSRVFEAKLRSKELSQYIHDLTEPLGLHVLDFAAALTSFIEDGVPTIR